MINLLNCKMKKIYKLILLTSLYGTTAILGCKKYLEVKSDARLVVPTSISDAQGLMDDAANMNLRTSPSYGEATADDIFLPPTSYQAVGNTAQDVYTWKPTPYQFVNDWSLGYLAIYNSNLCLEILDKVTRLSNNAGEWDNAAGSAHFYRAYYLLMLTGQYGLAYDENTASNDLGVSLRLQTNFNIPSNRATVAECYQQVIDDAQKAFQLLPNYAAHQMRPSKMAAAALLARCYLYMHNYETALKYAREALALNSQLINYNGDADLISLSSTTPFRKFNKETIWYAELSGGFGVHALLRARIDSNLYASYAANDLRKTAYFRAAAPYQQFKGNYTANINVNFSGFATDELYLISAECKAWLNDVDGGMADLNTLLKTRFKNTATYVPLTAANRAEALTKIRTERRKELVLRGLRFYDIKRYNKEGANINLTRVAAGQTYTLKANSGYYALPLPTDIIQLTGMAQN